MEDAEHFGQRPKIDGFDDSTFFVVHGTLPDGSGLVELHIFFSEHSLVTVHRGECSAVTDVIRRMDHRHTIQDASAPLALLYMIVDTLVDTFFPVLSRFDLPCAESFRRQGGPARRRHPAKPTEQQLGVLFDMKRSLIAMRKVVTPQRDMFAALASGVIELSGMTKDGERYFRDLYDHLIRIADVVDSYRDLLSGVMDSHVSTVSNRLNVVMMQLTIIATIFLPLSPPGSSARTSRP